ncbi:MAG: hypothetical protein PHI71_01855 [Acidiphilium sp.]|nr:hypothetical protein [Acidiphilium sp.]
MAKANKAAEFLAAMSQATPPAVVEAQSTPKPTKRRAVGTRAGLKHIGGYFERDTVEKFAVLRARLDLDNSELIKRAVEELHARVNAKRAFGDD